MDEDDVPGFEVADTAEFFRRQQVLDRNAVLVRQQRAPVRIRLRRLGIALFHLYPKDIEQHPASDERRDLLLAEEVDAELLSGCLSFKKLFGGKPVVEDVVDANMREAIDLGGDVIRWSRRRSSMPTSALGGNGCTRCLTARWR
ncbi:MAG: hypothetical protein U5Q44_06495 [Dehalococcoidia bacterium]|nr:hypothetical protein [Dehalococcoidia bacterium]